MDDTDYNALYEKINELTVRNIKLEKQNRNMVKSINHYKRVVRGYKQKLEIAEKKNKSSKQHYKNGVRGTKYNG